MVVLKPEHNVLLLFCVQNQQFEVRSEVKVGAGHGLGFSVLLQF